MSQEFRLKEIDETRNYFIEEINWRVESPERFVQL